MRYEIRGRVIDEFTGDGIGGLLTRRDFLWQSGGGLGGLALAFMVEHELALEDTGLPAEELRPPVPKLGMVPMMFWLNVTGDKANQIVDTPYREALFRRTNGYVIYNSEVDGYAEWVAASKAEHPDVRILRYAHVQQVPKTTRVAGTWFPDCETNGKDWGLILKSTGKPKVTGGTPPEAWMDITNSCYRAKAVEHLVAQMKSHGCDGLALDGFHAQLEPSADPYVNGDEIERNWLAGCQAFLKELHEALPPGSVIMFNGLWRNQGPDQLEAQAKLLPFADLAVVEHYPHDFNGEMNALDINSVLAAHPKQRILVSGTRAGENNFYTYADDLQNARWSLGWYLVGKTPGAHFRYGQNLRVQRLARERSGGATISGYANLPLGEPIGPATSNGTGGYQRVFEGGIAFVSPDSGPQLFVVPFNAWSVTGGIYPRGFPVKLPARDGLILMRWPVPPPPEVVEYDVSAPATDYLMEMVTDEWLYTTLEVGVRSNDPGSALLFRFETDDSPRPFGILRIMPDMPDGSFSPGRVDYPYRYDTTLGAAHVTGPTYTTSGTSTPLCVELTKLAVPCYQVRSVRVVGSVQMEYLRLRTPSPLNADSMRRIT